ncbi:MAG: polysaccharide pyruvyl transferase family protein [Oscillospiraceae bacterium]|nr:polysaccharide pyruvyl transferase family protein [Oscillospiraceae bacterium]
MNIKNKIANVPLLGHGLLKCRKFRIYIELYNKTKKKIMISTKFTGNRIFYLGIPAHSNLGDLAQGVCIRRWLKKHYPDKHVVEIETNALVNTSFPLLDMLKKTYQQGDFIVFQSGYTTTDLGGYADEMHRAVIQVLPDARILMMPQTIFFEHKENEDKTAKVYSMAKNMLFLARDRVSFAMACNMFDNTHIKQFPDIVTTLIGTKEYKHKRDGILFCCRDDVEKFYSDKDIADLIKKCEDFSTVSRTDTTKYGNRLEIVNNAEKFIYEEIDNYAHYKVIITDRYHGTILSLVAGTPVIIIKSNDHKVITGAEWFKGVYDDYVYVADSLDNAYDIAKNLYNKELAHMLSPYFENMYYDKLPRIFKSLIIE